MTEKKHSTRFKKGQSGNPAGKPVGARSRATMLMAELLEEGAAEVARHILTAARGGDMGACRLILDKLLPPAKERPVVFSIELDTDSPESISASQRAILQAVGEGDILLSEAERLSTILENSRRAIETEELAARLDALEQALRKGVSHG